MTATDTYLLLRAFCDELARCGMEHACTVAGLALHADRPLARPRAADPLLVAHRRALRRLLRARRREGAGRPVAVTCTSGTAAANLAPAVIEAARRGCPLIVLTADRPPELREVGAGQTIDQLKLYGDAVKWFVEVGVHEATADALRWIRTLACRAYWTALDGPPGPVHLNFPLREPLVLDEPLPADDTGRPDGRPYVAMDTAGSERRRRRVAAARPAGS